MRYQVLDSLNDIWTDVSITVYDRFTHVQRRVFKYKETKIGDEVLDRDGHHTYKASIHDADDLNWILVTT